MKISLETASHPVEFIGDAYIILTSCYLLHCRPIITVKEILPSNPLFPKNISDNL